VNRLLVIGVLFLLISSSGISISGVDTKQSPTTIYDGKTLYVGGSGPGNYTKIQDAINDSSDGDTVFVFDDSSPYYEHLEINQSINLVGEDRTTTIIDSKKYGHVMYVYADFVTIKEFTIRNGELGILLYSNNNKIMNNIISTNSEAGLHVSYSSNNSIVGNDLSDCGSGLILFYSRDNTISNNLIISNDYEGIYFYRSKNSNIFANNISYNGLGVSIHFQLIKKNIFYHNNFIENDRQVYDAGDNKWDNEYPSCGNYWSDYTGSDVNGDGIGDTPYLIPWGREDRYPLMEPFGMTELSLNFIRGGIFKISGDIKNIGNHTALNVQWNIRVEGGFVLLGTDSSGTIPKPILAGEEGDITTGIILGFSPITITVAVWADNAPYISRTTPGLLLLFFIQIRPGGVI
jgi:parallel beta-helix repeat protein